MFKANWMLTLGLALWMSAGSMAHADYCKHNDERFRCVKFVDNYDGDTVTVDIPSVHPLLGDRISVRVVGIDTPELRSDDNCERERGYTARQEVEKLLATAKRIDLVKIGRDKYFRIIADIEFDGRSLSEHMLKNDLAVPYDGGTKAKVDWCKR